MTAITTKLPMLEMRDDGRDFVYGRRVTLTTKERRLLIALVGRRGRPLSRVWLYRKVWRGNPTDDSRALDMHISRLRGKLGRAAHLIQTVRGVGYRFE